MSLLFNTIISKKVIVIKLEDSGIKYGEDYFLKLNSNIPM